jgi:hypothetical protein
MEVALVLLRSTIFFASNRWYCHGGVNMTYGGHLPHVHWHCWLESVASCFVVVSAPVLFTVAAAGSVLAAVSLVNVTAVAEFPSAHLRVY